MIPVVNGRRATHLLCRKFPCIRTLSKDGLVHIEFDNSYTMDEVTEFVKNYTGKPWFKYPELTQQE